VGAYNGGNPTDTGRSECSVSGIDVYYAKC